VSDATLILADVDSETTAGHGRFTARCEVRQYIAMTCASLHGECPSGLRHGAAVNGQFFPME
jgi:hypothetical protein